MSDPTGEVITETFKGVHGRKVVSRASAANLGSITRFALEENNRRIAALILGKGRKAKLIDWEHIVGFGPDAVIANDDAAVREASDEREMEAADGKFEVLGKRVISDAGNDLGEVGDVSFDPEKGEVIALLDIGGRTVPISALRGVGPYAAVVSAEVDPDG